MPSTITKYTHIGKGTLLVDAYLDKVQTQKPQ